MNVDDDNELEQSIRLFVARETGADLSAITSATDVVRDLRLCGDDVVDLIQNFAAQFHVDVTSFRWYHHTGPEGCNPFWFIIKPWWAKKTRLPIRLSTLVESAKQHRWTMHYPPE